MTDKPISGSAETGHTTGIRRFDRYRIDVRVKVFPKSGETGVSVTFGRGTDISENGMALYLPATLTPNDAIEMELKFPYSNQLIRIGGAVRNADGFRYGVEFSDLDQVMRDLVARTCKTLSLLQ